MGNMSEQTWNILKEGKLSLIAYSKATFAEILEAVEEMKKWMPNTLKTREEKKVLTFVEANDERIVFSDFIIERSKVLDEHIINDIIMFHMEDNTIAIKVIKG